MVFVQQSGEYRPAALAAVAARGSNARVLTSSQCALLICGYATGMGILDELAKRRHGLIEDAKVAAQLTVSR